MRKVLVWLLPRFRPAELRLFTAAAMVFALSNSVAPTATLEAAPPERPTFNHTEDPRPNILPNWIFNHHVPYRLEYNRPTYYGGKIAYHIAPSSQEAMVWEENLEAGRYNGHNCPPVYKRYMYPKPWEALNTQPRPTFARTTAQAGSQPAVSQPAPPVDLKSSELVPAVQQ